MASSITSVPGVSLAVSHAVSRKVQEIINGTPVEFSGARDVFVKLDPKTQENLATFHESITQKFYKHQEDITQIFELFGSEETQPDARKKIIDLYKSLKVNFAYSNPGGTLVGFNFLELLNLFFKENNYMVRECNSRGRGIAGLPLTDMGDKGVKLVKNYYYTFFVSILRFVTEPGYLTEFYDSLSKIKSYNADSDFKTPIKRMYTEPEVVTTDKYMLRAMRAWKEKYPYAKMAYHVFGDAHEQGGCVCSIKVSQEELMAELFPG